MGKADEIKYLEVPELEKGLRVECPGTGLKGEVTIITNAVIGILYDGVRSGKPSEYNISEVPGLIKEIISDNL